jgi:hypothetical protein
MQIRLLLILILQKEKGSSLKVLKMQLKLTKCGKFSINNDKLTYIIYFLIHNHIQSHTQSFKKYIIFICLIIINLVL